MCKNLPAWEPRHQLDHCLHIEFLGWNHNCEDKQPMSTISDQPDNYLDGKKNIKIAKKLVQISEFGRFKTLQSTRLAEKKCS